MHMQYKFATPLVVKFGGSAMGGDGEAYFAREVAALQRAGRAVVVVHGGGPEIDRALAEAGLPMRRVEGQRVTDRATLEVTERVLCGTLNKRLVRALAVAGVRAVGISGMDGGLLQCGRMVLGGTDLGFVGQVERADPRVLQALLASGFAPVVAPVGMGADGEPLNVNADGAAGAIAASLGASELLLLTNVARVWADAEDRRSGVERFSLGDAVAFAASEACGGSMKPKIAAAIAAVSAGVTRARIGSAPLAQLLGGDATTIEGDPPSVSGPT